MVAATTITTTMTVRLPLRSPPRLGAAPLRPRRRLRQVDTPGSTSRTSRRPQGGPGQTGRHRFLRETQGKNFTNILTELEKLYFFSTNQAPLKTYFSHSQPSYERRRRSDLRLRALLLLLAVLREERPARIHRPTAEQEPRTAVQSRRSAAQGTQGRK